MPEPEDENFLRNVEVALGGEVGTAGFMTHDFAEELKNLITPTVNLTPSVEVDGQAESAEAKVDGTGPNIN